MKHIPEPHRPATPSECDRTRLAQSCYAAAKASAAALALRTAAKGEA